VSHLQLSSYLPPKTTLKGIGKAMRKPPLNKANIWKVIRVKNCSGRAMDTHMGGRDRLIEDRVGTF